MIRWTRPIILLQEQMQIANLVKNNWVVNDTCFFNLIKLLNCIVPFQIKTKDTIHSFAHSASTSNQENFLS